MLVSLINCKWCLNTLTCLINWLPKKQNILSSIVNNYHIASLCFLPFNYMQGFDKTFQNSEYSKLLLSHYTDIVHAITMVHCVFETGYKIICCWTSQMVLKFKFVSNQIHVYQSLKHIWCSLRSTKAQYQKFD